MIRTHEKNTRWWGAPVGILTDAAWFAQDAATRAKALEPFAWVEFKAPLNAAPPALELCRAGFALTDVQMNFRISLGAVPDSPSIVQYECISAAEEKFALHAGDARPFEHERFLELPGVTATILDARYTDWANEWIEANPGWCLRLVLDGKTQGWFLSECSGGKVGLTLAMLSSQATVSGQHLYQCALREYAKLGGSIGHAAFSVRNTAVLNIYSNLGAKFTAPTGVWIWVRA